MEFRLALREIGFLGKLAWRMSVQRPELRREFWHTVTTTLRHNPAAFEFTISLITFYLHLGTFASFLIADLDRQIAELEVEAAPDLAHSREAVAPLIAAE